MHHLDLLESKVSKVIVPGVLTECAESMGNVLEIKKSMRKDWRISECNINVSMASQDQIAFFYMKSRQFCKASRYNQHQHQSNVCS